MILITTRIFFAYLVNFESTHMQLTGVSQRCLVCIQLSAYQIPHTLALRMTIAHIAGLISMVHILSQNNTINDDM